MTVPETEGSALAKRPRIAVAKVNWPKGTTIKVVEWPGPPLLQGLTL